MISVSAWAGVQSLLDNYFEICSGDYVVIVYTSDTYEYASWVSAGLVLRGIPVVYVWMIPLQDPEFPARFRESLPAPAAIPGRLVVLTLERDTLSHDAVLDAELSKFQASKTMVYRVISTCDELFTCALLTNPADLSALNTTLLEWLIPAESVRITTPSGSSLELTLDSKKHRWISNRGVWRPERFVILPAGEVATFPATINGTFVADFAFNVNMITEVDARLSAHPVTVRIEENRAVEYTCSSELITRFLNECFYGYCAYTVGELGFGTNLGVREPITLNSHINERHPGIHLGFGQSNQSPAVVGYDCNIHLDLIARGGKVWVDDHPQPLDLVNINKSVNAHPTYTSDEDARSSRAIEDLDIDDCCGILTSEGIRLFDPKSASSQSIGTTTNR